MANEMENRHLVFISDLGHTGPIWPQILDGMSQDGWRVTILTPKLNYGQRKFFHLNYRNRKWSLVQTKEFSSPYRSYQGYPGVVRKVLQMFSKVIPSSTILQDAYLGEYARWKEVAVCELKRLLLKDPFELILTSSSPFVSHVIANEFLNSHDVYWIADYRDLWSLNHNLPVFDKTQVAFENEVLSKAVACSTASEGFAQSLANIYSGPIKVVLNGFDRLYEPRRIYIRRKVRIVYPGQIYENFQDIRPILKALSSFNSKNFPTKFELFVSGYAITYVKRVARDLGILGVDWLDFGKVLPLKKNLELQRNADLLLLLGTTDPKVKGIMQTKLFEYISSGVPIVVSGGSSLDESSLLISKTRTGFLLNNEDDIFNFLNDLVARHSIKLDPNLPLVQGLTRHRQGLEFSHFVKNII